MIKIWRKELTDEEKLKKEVIEDLNDEFIKNRHSDAWNENIKKQIFGMPHFDNIDWIHQFYLQDDLICYLINKTIISDLINKIENTNKDCISILRNAIYNYKRYSYVEQPTEETSESYISSGFIKSGGWVSGAFQNSRTACLRNIIIPYLEWIVAELNEHGCFHARAEIVDENKEPIPKFATVRNIGFKRIKNNVEITKHNPDDFSDNKMSLSFDELENVIKELK